MHHFVKDKTNLAPHNLWLGGDYTNDTTDLIVTGGSEEVTDEWSTNYSKCFKITKTSTYCYIYVWQQQEYDSENKTLQISIDQKIPTSSFHLQIIQFNTNKEQLKVDQVGGFIGSANPLILTAQTVENVNYITIRIARYGEKGEILYLDNIIVTESD